jgi:hypothetical protein
VCFDAEGTWRWLRAAAPDLPLQFIFYTWPSEGYMSLLPATDLGILGRRGGFNGIYLAQLIAELPPDTPICLIGHSHGARAVASALHLLGGGDFQGYRSAGAFTDRRPIRAVFAAAAMDHHWLVPGQRYGQALFRAESVLNLRNQADFALRLYPFRRPFSNQALGRVGLSSKDRRLLGPYQFRMTELDVTALLGDAHFWPTYYSRPEIARAIVPWVYFTDLATPCPPTVPQPLYGETRRLQP